MNAQCSGKFGWAWIDGMMNRNANSHTYMRRGQQTILYISKKTEPDMRQWTLDRNGKCSFSFSFSLRILLPPEDNGNFSSCHGHWQSPFNTFYVSVSHHASLEQHTQIINHTVWINNNNATIICTYNFREDGKEEEEKEYQIIYRAHYGVKYITV